MTRRVAARPRDYVRVAGPDAEDFLQRMLSNDVTEAPCRAMLLTPKARLIAPLVVVRRADDDFLLLTEPGLGETVARPCSVRGSRPRSRSSRKSTRRSWSSARTAASRTRSSASRAPSCSTPTSRRRCRPTSSSAPDRVREPAWGKELDDTILPAEAGLDETHVSFTKGCYPGQEPIARLRHRGKVNRALRALEVDGAQPGDEIRHGDKVVGRVTSAVADGR